MHACHCKNYHICNKPTLFLRYLYTWVYVDDDLNISRVPTSSDNMMCCNKETCNNIIFIIALLIATSNDKIIATIIIMSSKNSAPLIF